jgi:dTDP-4-amino-4,6-dideoxygalactose transaminase
MELMKMKGIQTSVHYPPIHKFQYYVEQDNAISLPITEEIAEREVTLPMFASLDPLDVTVVVEAIKEVLNEM